jgi:hypothetical protein
MTSALAHRALRGSARCRGHRSEESAQLPPAVALWISGEGIAFSLAEQQLQCTHLNSLSGCPRGLPDAQGVFASCIQTS